ncbi:Cysteine-rich_membrane protein 2 [Hexamita inflata]|uniref:Cysteine-rich membrane protein 2 n=1 Tax=Hexamita inflata TaxID=28002 RepID=A0AA86NI00_9EUKA|nr:Cysteine-rich membrane protein 2 [Hexamita inflata]
MYGQNVQIDTHFIYGQIQAKFNDQPVILQQIRSGAVVNLINHQIVNVFPTVINQPKVTWCEDIFSRCEALEFQKCVSCMNFVCGCGLCLGTCCCYGKSRPDCAEVCSSGFLMFISSFVGYCEVIGHCRLQNVQVTLLSESLNIYIYLINYRLFSTPLMIALFQSVLLSKCLDNTVLNKTSKFTLIHLENKNECKGNAFHVSFLIYTKDNKRLLFQKQIVTKQSRIALTCKDFLGNKSQCDMNDFELVRADILVHNQDESMKQIKIVDSTAQTEQKKEAKTETKKETSKKDKEVPKQNEQKQQQKKKEKKGGFFKSLFKLIIVGGIAFGAYTGYKQGLHLKVIRMVKQHISKMDNSYV